MKKVLFTLSILGLFSCNKAKESAQDALTRSMEKAIENKTGTQVDLPDASNLEKNLGYVVFKTETETYLTGKEKMQATVTINKDNQGLSFALQFTGENGKSFLAMISKIPEDFSLPLKAKFSVSNAHDGINPVATIIFMNITENGVLPNKIPFEGDLVITELSKEKVTFKINAKGGDASNTESPSNWKPISGDGKLSHPIIISNGIDKNKILK